MSASELNRAGSQEPCRSRRLGAFGWLVLAASGALLGACDDDDLVSHFSGRSRGQVKEHVPLLFKGTG